MKVSVEKLASPEELVEHAGVKGMRWGVRKETGSTGGTAGRSTAGRSTAQVRRDFRQKFPTAQLKTQEIRRARVQEQAMRLKAMGETDPVKREKLIKEWRDSPDRAIALRTTRGEKVFLGVLAGVLAPPSFGAAPAALAGYTGTTLAIRKGIERGQAKRARQ